MALFNHISPYSNLHDINLDWIIATIKSIDPAVIKALQNLTPDIIAQVNQYVTEAQSFAVSARSSADEANTSKETAATSANEAAQEAINANADAALANAEAVRAENAANNAATAANNAATAANNAATAANNAATAAVNTTLEPTTLTVNASARSVISDSMCVVSGKIATIFIVGTMQSKAGGSVTTCAKIGNWPGLSDVRFLATILRDGVPIKQSTAFISNDGGIRLYNSDFDVNNSFQIDTAVVILPSSATSSTSDVNNSFQIDAAEDIRNETFPEETTI